MYDQYDSCTLVWCAFLRNPYRNEAYIYITLYVTQTFYSNCLFDRWDHYKIV